MQSSVPPVWLLGRCNRHRHRHHHRQNLSKVNDKLHIICLVLRHHGLQSHQELWLNSNQIHLTSSYPQQQWIDDELKEWNRERRPLVSVCHPGLLGTVGWRITIKVKLTRTQGLNLDVSCYMERARSATFLAPSHYCPPPYSPPILEALEQH